MKIVCDTTFLHGRDRFEKDDQRTVDDEVGAYFIQMNWAHEVGGVSTTTSSTPEVSLAIDNSVIGHGVRHG